ncbi:MAG: BON domain-containing protein [Pirellulales bacterium]
MKSAPLPLLHRVDSALKESPHLAGRHVLLEASDDVIILRGTVDSFYLKQVAQETVRKVDGIGKIENHLEVTQPRSFSHV